MKEWVCDWMLGCLLASPLVASDSGSIPHADDLQFRAVLYQVLQGDYQQALIEALVLDELGTTSINARTRIKLAEVDAGFEIQARGVAQRAVAELDDAQLEPVDRIRLAVLSARDAYRNGDWSGLGGALQQLGAAQAHLPEATSLPTDIVAEIEFMRAELATASGDFVRAETIIQEQIPVRSGLRAFALFNLGVALRASGMPDRATQTFAVLTSMPVYTEAALDVKQRALIALSLLKQQRTESASAESLLLQTAARGRYHNQAMATYANLSMDHGDYKTAARIWSELLDEAPWSTAGKAAQVGYPICLEHIATPETALGQFRLAQTRFAQRLRDLDTLMQRLGDADWDGRVLHALAALAEAPTVPDPALQEWRERLGNDDWLAWLTRDETQSLLHQLAELDAIDAWLTATPMLAAQTASSAPSRRAAELTQRTTRLASDYRSQLTRQMTDIVHTEMEMANRQLGLIRIGIARTTDRIAEHAAAAAP